MAGATTSGPWTPKYEDGKLYGRGGADDGYAVYAAIAAVQALQAQGVPHPRIVGLIETCEESGSFDLPPYIDALRPRLGDVGLVVCLDSGAGNYDQLWLTTSLRGMVSGTLKVEVLTEGVHSGDASGLVPSSFASCARCWTGWKTAPPAACCPPAFHCEVPAERMPRRRPRRAILGDEVYKRFPWACGDCGGSTRLLPTTTDPAAGAAQPHLEAHAQRHRRRGHPGAARMPATCCAPTPPSSSACACRRWWTLQRGVQELKALLEDNAPYQAKRHVRRWVRRHRLERARPAPWFARR
jgi:hypothetical protein